MMKEEVFAAVPLFIFMGFITEQAGLMERLFRAFRLLFAPVRGSLFIVVIVTATVFAMATGIVGASVTVLGIMAAPDHDQVRIRREACRRRDHRGRHAGDPDPAFGNAHRDGARARRLGGRPLRCGVRPRAHARRHLRSLRCHPLLPESEAGTSRPAGRADWHRLRSCCARWRSASCRWGVSSGPRSDRSWRGSRPRPRQPGSGRWAR